MKVEIDSFGWKSEMRMSWWFLVRGRFKKAWARMFHYDCPISPIHRGIFVNIFGVGIYFHRRNR
jgi:hypothetical protein